MDNAIMLSLEVWTDFLCLSYFACESFYNIAKVCKGEILMYFNEIFDALSKVSGLS